MERVSFERFSVIVYKKQDVLKHLKELGIDKKGLFFFHSSMKRNWQVDGGEDTVLDALLEYMKNGHLFFLPIHGRILMRRILDLLSMTHHLVLDY